MSQSKIYILHGWVLGKQTEKNWQPLLDQLQDAGYQLVFLKIPGLHQRLKQIWDLDDYVQWLETKLSRQQNLFLIGHSFGGQLAARYASLHQEQIDKLVLIGPAGIKDNSWSIRLKRAIFGLAAKIGKQIFKVLPGKKSSRWLLYKLAREKDYYQAYPELRQTMANVIGEDISNRLSSIEAETLLIWGMQDTASPFANSQIFSQEIVQSHLVSIPGARHSPQYTHANQVGQIIINFLDET